MKIFFSREPMYKQTLTSYREYGYELFDWNKFSEAFETFCILHDIKRHKLTFAPPTSDGIWHYQAKITGPLVVAGELEKHLEETLANMGIVEDKYGKYMENYERLDLDRLNEVLNCFCLAKNIKNASLNIVPLDNGYFTYSLRINGRYNKRKFEELDNLLRETIEKMGVQMPPTKYN